MYNSVTGKYLSLIVFLLLFTGTSKAQFDTLAPATASNNLIKLLPPLQLLIDSAIANSPDIVISESQLERSEFLLREERKEWSNLIGVTGRYTYGQFLATNDFGIGLTDPRGGYQIFAGVTLPLGFFTTRNDRVGALSAQMEINKQTIRQNEMDIREEVIKTYNQLMLLQRLINISAEARESAILQYNLAEERFREGRISLEELSSATNMRANFASEYEKLRAEFSQVYGALERLVGTPFYKFPKE